VLGGALGNLGDRMFRGPGMLRGAVVDFIDFRVWPVFNVADAAITVGCLLLLWAGWRAKE
jgi:signal peptidase II